MGLLTCRQKRVRRPGPRLAWRRLWPHRAKRSCASALDNPDSSLDARMESADSTSRECQARVRELSEIAAGVVMRNIQGRNAEPRRRTCDGCPSAKHRSSERSRSNRGREKRQTARGRAALCEVAFNRGETCRSGGAPGRTAWCEVRQSATVSSSSLRVNL